MKFRLRITFPIVIALAISTLAALPAKAAPKPNYYCVASFAPTPETERHVFSDMFQGADDTTSTYEKQFRSAVMNRYGLSDNPNVSCYADETEGGIRRSRDNELSNDSQYVNASGAVQVLHFHWVPSGAIRVEE